MRSFALAIVLILALAGCAELEIREDHERTPVALTSSSPTLPDHHELYRLTAEAPAPVPNRNSEPAPDYGLWTRLARDFTLHTIVHDRVDRELFGYLSRLDQLQTITRRAEPYLFFIVEQLRERGMPMELALLPIVESAYQPMATSRAQAAGLWQFIPSTGQHFGLKQTWWYDGRRDIHASTQAALDYLQRLNDMFGGDWPLALAAYNAGEGTVSRAIERAAAKGEPTDYWSLELPEETKAYVPRLIALSRLFRDPHVYGLTPHKVEDAPFLARLEFDRPLDLSKVANAVEMSVDDLYRLNPGFKRGVTGHGKETIALLLPQDKAHRLRNMDLAGLYASLPPPREVKITREESLASFAARHKLSVASLRELNPLVRDKLTRGQTIILPATAYRSSESSPTPATNTASKVIQHAVSPGENLYQISRKHGVDARTLATWNGLKPDTPLKAGQILIIYGTVDALGSETAKSSARVAPSPNLASREGKPQEKTQELARAIPKSPTSPEKVQKTTYTVQKGDTLFSIARRFKVEVALLRQWNRLGEKDELKPGQTIVVVLAERLPKAS